MALLASTEMLPEPWMSAPTQIQSHALPEDIWSKFDIEHDRALVMANPTAMDTSTSLPFGGTDCGPFSSPPHQSNGGYMGGMGVTILPTPPRSPPTEHDLDDLVASIPEILESPIASPPSDISDIISDLETSSMNQSMDTSNWINLWSPLNTPITLPSAQSLKSDIMWGGGLCCAPALEPAAKKRNISECSVDRALANVLKPDNDLSDSDDDDNLPDTPSGTDSDGDESHMSDTSIIASPRSTSNSPHYSPNSTSNSPHYSPHHYHHHHHSHHHQHRSNVTTISTTTTHHDRVIVNSEHNYCGRVPEINPQHLGGSITPSDTEDEVDVVGDHHIPILTSTPMVTSTTSSHLITPSKRSEDVKRKLQLAINESRLKKQNKAMETSSPIVSSTIDSSSRFVSVKIKTQGKPASYTKRMREYHSEQVLKSTKNNRRRNRGESDEGRRSVHNSLERQRRVDLRNAFETLRLLVPDTKVLDKAPKVQILKKAAFHCKALQIQEQRLLREKEKLKKQIDYLKQQRRICS